MTFATVSDYSARHGAPADESRCAALLDDASALLESEYLARYGSEWEEGAHPAFDRGACAVACAVVSRALDVPEGFLGATQYTQTAGSYSASMTMANPTADLYLTKSDRVRLGIVRRGGAAFAAVEGASDGAD